MGFSCSALSAPFGVLVGGSAAVVVFCLLLRGIFFLSGLVFSSGGKSSGASCVLLFTPLLFGVVGGVSVH